MDIVSNLKTGDVILFHTAFNIYKPSTWVGAIIRLFIDSHYNHVGIVVSNWEVNFVNEATGKGITAHLASHKLDGKKYKVLRSREPVNQKVLARVANNLLGVTKYNYFVLVVVMFWYKMFGHWILKGSQSSETDRMVCSTYVAYCHDLQYWYKADPSLFEKLDKFEVIYKN